MMIRKLFPVIVAGLTLAISSEIVQGQGLPSVSTSITSNSVAIASMAGKNTQEVPLPRVFTPTLPRATYTRYPWKNDIMATVFWVGELPTQNNPTPNTASSWDVNWTKNFGGYDDPSPKSRAADYRPAAFVPKLNPFYIALPYNDCQDYKTTKAEVPKIIPWFKQEFKRAGRSICKDRWIAIRYGSKVCYAQWSDCGPFLTNDGDYVFGDARPQNASNKGAGIDVSPAVRDYLEFKTNVHVDWRFVDEEEVPDGPWKMYGSNNPFSPTYVPSTEERPVVASRLEELRRQRDEWFSGTSAAKSNAR